MKFLFLGGSGFLGRALIGHFGSRGHEVHAVIRSHDAAEKIRSVHAHASLYSPQQAGGQRYDQVINLIVNYGRGGTLLSDVIRTNLLLPLEIVESVETTAVLNISSALPAEYSDYAASKKMLEASLNRVAAQRGFRNVNVHLHNIYGPGFDETNLVSAVIARLLRHERLELASGRNSRDFIYLDDAVTALEVLFSRLEQVPSDSVVQIGTGRSTQISDLVAMAQKKTGSDAPIAFGARPDNPREPRILVADLAAISATNWAPAWTLDRGLDATIRSISGTLDD